MARAEKRATLTMEERLEQALVPDWEHPYKVPENWVWTRAGIISELNPPKQQPEDLETKITFVPMAAVSEESGSIETPEIRPAKSVVKGFTSFREGDVIFAKITPCMENGKVAIAENLKNEFGYGSTEFFVFRPSKAINKKLLYYFLRNPAFRDEAKQNMSGAVGQQRVSKVFLSQHAFPLPPLAEQQRIVNRIESLFSKLDEAKEKAQAALDSFETRKAAILHKAFTGELTDKWRKEHGVGMESWETKTSKELFEYVTSGSRGWAQYYSDNGAVFIRMGNLDHGTIELDLTDIQYVQLPDKAEGRRSRIQKDDILISITADVGMVGFMREINYEAYINQHVALARPSKSEYAEFIAWYLVSDVGLKQLQRKQRGATKVGLGLDDIRSLQLHMPSIPEKLEIVRILDDLFAKEQQAKNACANMLGQIDLIKKSILDRAFRGELGTNDPNEESAVELLKQCLAQQANEQKQASKKERTPVVVISDEVRSQLSSKLERDIYLSLQKNGPTNMREIASISKKDLDVIEALRQLEKKGLIQKHSNGEYRCVR